MSTLSILDSCLEKVSSKIRNLNDEELIGSYLDMLESRILEMPFGDMIYEHAFEVAQVKIQELKASH